MIKYGNEIFFYLFFLIPLLVLIYIFYRLRQKKQMEEFGQANLVALLHPLSSSKKKLIRFIVLLLAATTFIIVLINPKTGSKIENIKRKGAELIICLDVSNSMYAEDIKPNRINRAKQAIMRLIDKLEGDRIGLIIFAGKSYVQLPITSDYAAAKMLVSTVSPELIPVQGTAVGDAINLAIQSFPQQKDDKKNRAIIVISDGENHEDDAILAATEAAKQGIFVHTIGMGSPEGAPIPIKKGNSITYKKDANGNTVITKLDEALLQKVASVGNGIYVRATNNEVGLSTIFDEINKLDKVEQETRDFSDYEDRFQFFIWLTLIFMIAEMFIFERKLKIFRGINLFKTDEK